MSFAASSFASIPFASSFAPGPSVRRAIARLNAVDVEFTEAVRAFDPTLDTNATNVDVWTLAPASPISGATIPRVQYVTDRDGDGLVMRVFFDADLTEDAEYTIEVAATVRSEDLATAVSAPRSVGFVVPIRAFVPVGDRVPREVRTDLRSTAGRDAVSGTMRYDETGDLANESGVDYLRKRMLRRATALRGSFFHLPGYGAGKRLKGNVSSGDIAQYRSQLRAQLLLEPDVRDVAVSVARLARNVLRVSMRPTNVDGVLLPEVATTIDLTEED